MRKIAKFTTELRTIVNSKDINGEPYNLGLNEYPIYKEEYRETLNKKIIQHFYFREIGLETTELFKMFLNRKMNEIMPFYNQMYKSSDIEFNPLWNVEMHETYTHTIEDTGKTIVDGTTSKNGTENSNQDVNSSSKENIVQDSTVNVDSNQNVKTSNTDTTNEDNLNIKQDTPQSALTDEDIKGSIYASSTDHNKNDIVKSSDIETDDNVDSETTQNSTSDNTTTGVTTSSLLNETSESLKQDNEINVTNKKTETFTRLEEGSSAGLPYSDAIKQWRKIMVNIDMLIIEELEPLFMQLW